MSKSRCGCVYADAKNTASVRLGYEMGGYLKEPCAKHDRMTQPMSSEMRECPFCGNQPRSGWQGTGVPGMDDCGYWGIDCCNAFAHADTEAEALAQWNRRSDAPNGSWLWCKLMDFCQKRRFPPAEFNDLFAIVTEANELNNRALLARTEAGADDWPFVEEIGRDGKPTGYWIRKGPAAAARNTHPQDASGDAREAERYRWLRDEASRAQLEMFADRRGTRLAADRVCDAGIDISAMQAKEAK